MGGDDLHVCTRMAIVPTGRMHADELETDEALVRRLLAAQFPQWAELPIEALAAGGTDNAIYRLGDELSVRLPRRRGWRGSLDDEFEWLPKLAPLLPLPVPTPVARGVAGEGYPHEWAVYGWLDGEDATSVPLDLPRAAVDLAELHTALQRIDPKGGPPPGGRGGPLGPRDEATRAWIAELGDAIDTSAVTAAWEAALAAPEWDRAPVWIHGDLDARNLLVAGRGHHRGPRLGLRLRRRSGLRREGCVGRPRRGNATGLPRAARDRRRDVGSRSRLGALAGDRGARLLHAHLPGDRPGSPALARRGAGRLLDRSLPVREDPEALAALRFELASCSAWISRTRAGVIASEALTSSISRLVLSSYRCSPARRAWLSYGQMNACRLETW